jgi:hypothetical protein
VPDRLKIRDVLDQRFSREELELLCFDLKIPDGTISINHQQSKRKSATDIVIWWEKLGRLSDLVTYIRKQYPNAL